MSIRKEDLADLDVVDAIELASDGLVGVTSPFYSAAPVTSTTSGTKTVIVPVDANGEGLLSVDHLVKPGDKALITGTSGGLGNGTFTVATVPTQTSFTTVESIGTSTGGTVTFEHKAGGSNVGVDSTNFASSASTDAQGVLTAHEYGLYLDAVPNGVQYTYAATRSGGVVTQETWTTTATSKLYKSIDYTRSGGVVSTIVTKVFKTDGTTVVAQTTETLTRTGGVVTSSSKTRDV